MRPREWFRSDVDEVVDDWRNNEGIWADHLLIPCTCGHANGDHDQHTEPHPCMSERKDGTRCDCGSFTVLPPVGLDALSIEERRGAPYVGRGIPGAMRYSAPGKEGSTCARAMAYATVFLSRRTGRQYPARRRKRRKREVSSPGS